MAWKPCVALFTGLVLMASSALAGEVMVHLGHNKIEPAELTVKAGTTVVFHNLDAMPGGHSVVADDGSFASPGLAKDETWSHTFKDPGEYSYSLKEHPSAKGRIVVE
ncbi:MAG: amidase [Gemmatimonadetes bacterium]|nr:amidase [Gemmatimonadota bacterium]NIU76188.1 amidase [Gammaproteobacteria bacterium]NIX45713.1 amidase [Gemmatimonadota bacterium]